MYFFFFWQNMIGEVRSERRCIVNFTRILKKKIWIAYKKVFFGFKNDFLQIFSTRNLSLIWVISSTFYVFYFFYWKQIFIFPNKVLIFSKKISFRAFKLDSIVFVQSALFAFVSSSPLFLLFPREQKHNTTGEMREYKSTGVIEEIFTQRCSYLLKYLSKL